MANLRRNPATKVVKQEPYKDVLANHFDNQRMIAEWEELLAAAKRKEDLRTWQQALVSIENRSHGRPPQEVIHENMDVKLLMDAVKRAALAGGYIDAIATPVGGETVGLLGDGPSGVSEDVLAGGQLPAITGADGVPPVASQDSAGGGGSARGQEPLDGTGSGQVHPD